MDMRNITSAALTAFARHLQSRERSAGTIEKYVRDVGALAAFLSGAEVTRERAAA